MTEEFAMPDVCDLASDREATDTALALKAARERTEPPMPPNGHCYNCGEPVPTDARFCDCDCRDDWQARHRTPR